MLAAQLKSVGEPESGGASGSVERLASKLRGEVERLVHRGAEALGSATARGEVQSPEESDTTCTAVSEEKELTRSAGEQQAVSAAPPDEGDIGDRELPNLEAQSAIMKPAK